MTLLLSRASFPPHDPCAPGSDLDCDARAWKNLAILLVILGGVLYVVGAIFAFSWMRTRDYNRQTGTPWVPSCFHTERCCVSFEPIARYWPALLWPLFAVIICIHYVHDKVLYAVAHSGRTRRRKPHRKRFQAATRNVYDVDIEPGFVPDPACSSSSVISMPPILTPPPVYRLKRTSVASWVSLPARGPDTPPPHYQSRQNSASNLGDRAIMHPTNGSDDGNQTEYAVDGRAAESS